MDPFKVYSEAHLAMITDPTVKKVRTELEDAKKRHNDEISALEYDLDKAELHYRNGMEVAETAITAIVLVEQETKTLHGVKASYYSARASTSWKKVAEAMDPPTALIQENTSYSDPRVKVEIKE